MGAIREEREPQGSWPTGSRQAMCLAHTESRIRAIRLVFSSNSSTNVRQIIGAHAWCVGDSENRMAAPYDYTQPYGAPPGFPPAYGAPPPAYPPLAYPPPAFPGYPAYGAPPPAYGAPPASSDEVRTIFISGFPADVKDRELNNLMRFLPGYEVRTRYDPAQDLTICDPCIEPFLALPDTSRLGR